MRVEDPRVSSEHAVIQHTGQQWELKDLGSKNGTFLGTRRIGSGQRFRLGPGALFTLGGRGVTFELLEAGAPGPMARAARSGLLRVATKGMLALPDDNEPAITVFQGAEGTWIAESSNGEREVMDGDVIAAGDDEWRLELPSFSAATVDTSRMGPTIEMITLRFTVSRDEEYVELTVLHEGAEKKLAPRAFHYMLLTLARAWLADEGAPPTDRGWVEREDLCRMLNTEAGNLNVDVYRARGQLAALGIHGAASLVTRRPDSGQLRLGVHHVEVVSAWENGSPGTPSQP